MDKTPRRKMTVTERSRAYRQRLADKGLARLQLYAYPEDHDAIKELVARLIRRRDKDSTRKT
jgi:hypothetical protein